MAKDMGFEEREQLPSTVDLPQREPRRTVEHTPSGSFADNTDLLDPIRRQTYYPQLNRPRKPGEPETPAHGLKQHIDCEATESRDIGGHSGPATHFIQMPGEREDQREAVCAVHHAKLTAAALERGEYNISSSRIHPDDVQKHLALRGIQEREKRTYMERNLVHQGLSGEDALFARTSEELGKGGGSGATHLEEVKARRTESERTDALARALARAEQEGGRHSTPTVDVDGRDMTLGESNAFVSSLRRRVDPVIPGARKGNTENYYMAGVKSPDGSTESAPTSTRRFGINKAGAPNPKGGRKKKDRSVPWDTSNENLPGYTEAEMEANPALRKSQEERLSRGIPLEGIRPRGFSKTSNKATKVTLTGMAEEAPEVGIIESFVNKRQARQDRAATETMSLNAEAERLRKIEASKTADRESRSAAFEVSKNPNS
jgi:hypothetical protein